MEENNNIISQPVFEEPEFIVIHTKIKPFHKKILDTIDENTSNAIRKVIEYFFNHNQSINKDKMVLDFCIGMLLIGMGLLVSLWYAAIILYGTGIGCICYGILYYIENRRYRIR